MFGFSGHGVYTTHFKPVNTESIMPKRLGKFELPNRLVKVEETATDTFAVFQAEPFEAGCGHTIGTPSSCPPSIEEGCPISSIKIDGVQHEFRLVEGIVEDVTDIVLV